jgi:hypothetical protein
LEIKEERSVKRTLSIALAAAGVMILFGGLVYAVLVAARVSEPAAITVQGLTLRRLWATMAALVGLVGVIAGAVVAFRSTPGFGKRTVRFAASVAVGAGLLAAANGGLNLAIANGGPGTGNGVVGGAAAFVLGLIALSLGVRAFARFRHSALEPGQTA